MARFIIRTFRPDDQSELIELWRECGLIVPWNNPVTDIERKLSASPELFFVGLLEHELIASCMAGYDGHRGWIYFLAVKTARQQKGFASKMVAHAESELKRLGCPKVELMVRKTNQEIISFYQHIGYDTDPVTVLSKRLIEDEPHDFR